MQSLDYARDCKNNNFMQEEYILQQIGLSEKESRVYLACLQLGEASILQLAKKSELKRPHVYNVVESLSALGLLSKTQKQGKTLYVAENPKSLKQLLKQREEKINQILPSLEAFYNVPRGTKPKIKIYEGKKALHEQYVKMCESSEIDFFGVSVSHVINTLPETADFLLKEFKRKKTKVRELFNYSKADIDFAKKYKSPYHKIKIIPEGKEFFGDNALFDNKLVIVSLENLFMIVIEAEDLYKTFKTMFDLVWESVE